MNLRRHYRFVLAVALVLLLILLGRWAMLPDDAVNAPAPAERVASLGDPPAKAPPPTIAGPASDIAPSTDDVASSFGTLRGRVIDAVTREPVREFELEFHRTQSTKGGEKSPGARSFRTVDGRFEWQHAPADNWTVTASARGYQRFELADLRISSGETTPEIVLPLRPGHRLSGRVYDEISGTGIPSARIGFRESGVARFEGNWRMRVHVTSQKNGSFVLEGVPAGRVTLAIDAQEYAGRELDVVVDEETSPLEIGLSAGGTIAGYLAAADGVTPIAGQAGLFRLDQGSGGMSRTGEAGEFSFQHLPAGRYRLTGLAGGRSVNREIALASNERIEGIVLALSTGRSIRGVVTGLRPEDLGRVSISVHRDGNADGFLADVGVDARGAYVLHGVQPGRVRVVANVSMRRQLSRRVDMPADADMTVNLDFPRGARLSGRVTHNGKPLPGVWLEPRSIAEQDVFVYGVSTTGKGGYVIEDLAAGEYFIRVGPFRSRTVQLSGDTVFDIDVPLAQLAGRVLEEAGKVPVVEADVDIWPAQSSSSRIRLNDRSDHFGQFAIAGLEPGDFVLTVYKPGYDMYREPISYGSPTAGITIRLRQGKGVEVRAHEAGSGKPLQSVYAIEMIGDRNGSSLQLHLDENGIGYIPSALAGSTLSFSALGYVPAVIHEWSGQGLDLQLERQNPQ